MVARSIELLALMVVVGCGSSNPVTSTPAPSPVLTDAAVAADAALPTDGPRVDAAPVVTLDDEREFAVSACRQKNCSKLGKNCFDNCYRHAHPRDPDAHMRCNESCRRSYGVDRCEDACEAKYPRQAPAP